MSKSSCNGNGCRNNMRSDSGLREGYAQTFSGHNDTTNPVTLSLNPVELVGDPNKAVVLLFSTTVFTFSDQCCAHSITRNNAVDAQRHHIDSQQHKTLKNRPRRKNTPIILNQSVIGKMGYPMCTFSSPFWLICPHHAPFHFAKPADLQNHTRSSKLAGSPSMRNAYSYM